MLHSISVKSLSHSYGNNIIFEDTEIAFNTGKIIGLIAGNGTGKSTLFKILLGTLKPKNIDVYLDGQEISGSPNMYYNFGYHTQDIFLPKTMLVTDLISTYFDDGDEQNKIFYSPGVFEMENKRVYQLSEGERRYIQFLLVLNLKHKFLLLDEPFSMVAPLYRESIKEKLLSYKDQKGIIITDHYYQDVLDIADRIFTIDGKKIITGNNALDLINRKYIKK
jgi:ABC-type multidrug transport system ATPase subunit